MPKPPYKLQPLDGISLKATDVLKDSPIQGVYQVDTDGTINLGSSYGIFSVVGLTTAQAKDVLLAALKKVTRDPTLEVALAQSRGMQQVRGEPACCVRGDHRLGQLDVGNTASTRLLSQATDAGRSSPVSRPTTRRATNRTAPAGAVVTSSGQNPSIRRPHSCSDQPRRFPSP